MKNNKKFATLSGANFKSGPRTTCNVMWKNIEIVYPYPPLPPPPHLLLSSCVYCSLSYSFIAVNSYLFVKGLFDCLFIFGSLYFLSFGINIKRMNMLNKLNVNLFNEAIVIVV